MFAAQDGATPNDKLYVDDVFSAYTYTGDDASTRVITNGIDLAGNGGMVWIKGRDVRNHAVFDTARGTYARLTSNSTDAQVNPYNFSLKAFNSNGFSIGSAADVNTVPSINYVSWTFRKAAKFFDVVTYTGDGTNYRTVNHSLGIRPGLVIIKSTNTIGPWQVWARLNSGEMAQGTSFNLNGTAASNLTSTVSTHNSSQFETYINNNEYNVNGATYVAYLFAHDTSANGMIQCGSFTTDSSGQSTTVTLGWEPQYIMYKSSSSTSSWFIVDSVRGMPVGNGANTKMLNPNNSNAEGVTYSGVTLTATGFSIAGLSGSATYIYMAIRRPNKPPTSGTQVYNAIARTGTGAAATVTGVGFAPDLVIAQCRSDAFGGNFGDRLRGALLYLEQYLTFSESSSPGYITAYDVDGISVSASSLINANTKTYINYFFRRAVGVFDIVCYTGTGSATTVAHNLGVAPELVIVKARSATQNWGVYHSALTATTYIFLNGTGTSAVASSVWNNTEPTATVFTLGISGTTNGSGTTHVAYLFATKPGISKVGSYTGNGGSADSSGTSQTINCGFTTGARFVLLKCTSHTSDWVVVDTVRGLVAGNDPALSLNTTAAEVTSTDLLDPDTSGFIVNQLGSGTTSANFNVTGRTYIFLAFA